MKNNLLKLTLAIFLIALFFQSCEDTQGINDGNFDGANPEAGWVHFTNGSNEILIFKEDLINNETASIMIPVDISLPINTSDLRVEYSINDIVGASDAIVASSSDLIFPSGSNGRQMIEIAFDLDELENDIFAENVFDIDLVSTNSATVGVGVSPEENFPSSYRVTLSPPCFTPTIEGTYDFTSSNLQSGAGGGCPDGDGSATGSVTWTALGDDVYSSSDMSFGMFDSCWADDPATGPFLLVVCNELSTTGTDQYNDTYEYNIVEINGSNLTMEWENTYGDGGTVVLTRTDGTNWPDLALAE